MNIYIYKVIKSDSATTHNIQKKESEILNSIIKNAIYIELFI